MPVSSAVQGQETEQGKEQVQALIRIWPARSNARSASNEEANSRARMLADDLVNSMVEAKTDHERRGYLWAWGINDLSRTLAASRALQEAFDGFRAAAPAMKTTIAIVLDKAPAGEAGAQPPRPSLELTSLLDAAGPGQVLITQSFYKSADACQPLPLRSFAARAGVYEWLWTSSERLDRLHSDPDFGPTLVEEPRPALNTTTIPTIAIAPSEAAPSVPPQAEKVEISEPSSDELPASNLQSRKVAIAAVLAVAVAAGAGLWFWQRANHPTNTGAVHERVPHQGPETENVPLGEAAEIPLRKVDVFVPAALDLQTSPYVGSAPKQTCSVEDRVQIPYYLAMAEANRNRGQYEAAIREYNRVLTCDPRNSAAKQGKAKALEDQGAEQ